MGNSPSFCYRLKVFSALPKNKFEWTDELQTAFEASKKLIVEAIHDGVEIFDQTRRTCLTTDWSRSGMGYFLHQKHCDCQGDRPGCCADGWKVTLAGSRFLKDAETRYAPVEGEALAVAWALDDSKYFTLGCPDLTVITDHKPFFFIFVRFYSYFNVSILVLVCHWHVAHGTLLVG